MNTGDLGPLADKPAELPMEDKLHNALNAVHRAQSELRELREHSLPVGTVACWRGASFPTKLIDLLPPEISVRRINEIWFFVSKTQ
jgi:hypothetical protein